MPGVSSERALLGSILWAGLYEPKAIRARTVDSVVQRETFRLAANGSAFAAMLAVEADGGLTEPVAVASEARRMGFDVDHAYLTDLVAEASAPSSEKLLQWAKEIREAWLLRQVSAYADGVVAMCSSGKGKTSDVIDAARTGLLDLEQHVTAGTGVVSLKESLMMFLQRVTSAKHGGMSTGFRDIDRAVAGLFPREVSIVAARTSIGKSALAAQITTNLIAAEGVGALYASLEMSHESFSARIVAARAGVFASKLRRKDVNPLDLQKMAGAINVASDGPLYFADKTTQSMITIANAAGAVAADLNRKGKRLGLIVVDHLGLVKPSSAAIAKSNREQQVAELSRGLRYLAERFDCHVMALVQIGRDAEKQTVSDIPKLHHLRDSDAIAQDADVVFILHREKNKKTGIFNNEKPPALVVAKARNDEATAMLLGFEPKFVRFGDHDGPDTFEDVYR